MSKEVSVKIDNRYVITFEDKWVVFLDDTLGHCVSIPIEVFYQMWDSPEMCIHMENYYHMCKSVDE